MKFLRAIKPKTTRRSLLFMAAFVWSLAGFILLFRGITLSFTIQNSFWLKITASLFGGCLFYLVLFSRISREHVCRIINLKNDNPGLFSFFSIRSYILMIIMIASGITLRKSGIILPEYLAMVYITMGVPLMISALRFYYHGIRYR